MKNRINFRFLAALTLIVVLVGLTVVAINRFQAYRNSTILLRLAKNAVEEGDLPKGIQNYVRYLRIAKPSAEVLVSFADVLRQIGDIQQAFFNYEAALRLEPNLVAARQKLIESALELSRPSDAKSHLLDHLLKQQPDNPDFLWLLGRCEEELSELKSAETAYRKAYQANQDDPRYARELANLLANRLDKKEEGRAILDELVARKPTDPTVLRIRSRWLYEQATSRGNDPANAALLLTAWQDATSALTAIPNSAESAILLSDIAIARQLPADAAPFINSAIDATPGVWQLYSSASQLLVKMKDIEGAIQKLRDGLKVLPGHPDLTWLLARLEISKGNSDSASKLIADLRLLKYPEPQLKFLEAQVLASRGEWRTACTILEQTRPQFDRSKEGLLELDLLLATCYQRLGNSDQELICLRRALGINPNSLGARQALAEALSQLGRTQEAKSEYWQIVGQPAPSINAVLGLARLLLTEGLGQGAKNANWTQLERAIEILKQIKDASTEVAILEAEILVATGKGAEAEDRIRSEIAADPGHVRLYRAMVALQSRNKHWDQALETLKEAQQVLSDNYDLRLDRARVEIMRSGGKPDMKLLDDLASPPESWSPNDKMQLAAGFSNYYLSLEDYPRCENQLAIFASSELGKTSLRVYELLFELALRSAKLDAMASALDEVGKIEANGPIWRVGKAISLIVRAEMEAESDKKKTFHDEALNHLAEATLLRPAWARVPRLIGEIHDRQEKFDSAIESYLNAINLGEKDPQMISRAIFLLFQQKRFVEADKIVRTLQEQKVPFSTELTRVASQVSLQLENYGRALELAQDWTQKSGKPEDHAWLGEIYSISGNQADAEKEFRIAIEMAPDETVGWISLVQLYARSDKFEEARKVIEQATTTLGADSAADTVAQCYEAILDYRLAETNYLQAIKLRPDDFGVKRRLAAFYLKTERPAEASPLLEALIVDAPEIAERDRAWSRRNLAMILGVQLDSKNSERALELINQNLASASQEDDLRVKAIILGARQDKDSLQTSIKLFEQITSAQRAFALNDYFALAELYKRAGDWLKYVRTMRSVLGNGGADDAKYVEAYAQALVGRGELDEAKLWFDRLKALAPNEASTSIVQAKLFFHSRDYARLLMLLSSTNAQEQADWAIHLGESFAATLTNTGKKVEAQPIWDLVEKQLESKANASPDDQFELAAFLVRRGQIKKALEIAKPDNWSPEQISEVTLSAFENNSLTVEDARKLIVFAKQSYKANPQEVRLAISIGDLLSWIGDWKNASETYRRILQSDPSNIAALNNLASVLALSGQNLNEARQSVDRAIQIYGMHDNLIDTRGLVHLAAGELGEAEADFRMSISVRPSPEKFFHLAVTLSAQGKSAGAKEAFEEAKKGGVSESRLHPLERPIFAKLAQM